MIDISGVSSRCLVAAAILAAFNHPASAAPAADKVLLAPHRAVYDLTLARANGQRGVEAVRGRILYDFGGNACDGYVLEFRQVSELASSRGQQALTDLRMSTWEDGAAKKFTFKSENLLNQRSTEVVDGRAERRAKTATVRLSKPKPKRFQIPSGSVFPTEHLRRVIAAGRAGETVLEFPVYDGSENGEKIYDTLTVIGHPIGPGEKPPSEEAAQIPALVKLTRWPVTISYFEREQKSEAKGEVTPIYAISFELYENGVSRKLTLDYTDFAISGEMTSLDMKPAKPCK